MLKIYCCYTHEDKAFLKKLEKHLAPLLKGTGVFDSWSAYEISFGIDWRQKLEGHLEDANLLLLLVSPDFISSDLCYSLEMQQVIERQQEGRTLIIPIILRAVLWQVTPLGKLQSLPRNARPIALWRDRDAAFLSVVSEIWVIMQNLIDEEYKKARKTYEALKNGRPQSTSNNFEFRQLVFSEEHVQIYSKYIRSLKAKRRKLLRRAKWIFIRRKFINNMKYLFKRSPLEKRAAILENEEFLWMSNQILGLKETQML